MKRNVYVLGLLDWQRKELETIRDADLCRFHSLLGNDELLDHEAGFDELLRRARKQLSEGDKPDAIVCHWDFPSSCLAPILAAEQGLAGPSLESVLRCEHKYWARLEQTKAAPECIPEFEAVDPFDPEAADKFSLGFPLWLKPIKGFSSQLGFRVENREELEEALEKMREEIGDLGRIFDECLDHAELPPEVQGIGGSHAIAEGIMSGHEFAHEGYVRNNKVTIHGLLDIVLSEDGKIFSGLRYPADLPGDLEERANDVSRRIMEQVGYDDGCFNVEFLHDKADDKLWVIEVNTRISQSHSELFRKVDGRSNHEIAVSVALGEEPTLPDKKGNSKIAGKFYITKREDAEVTREPSESEIEKLSDEFDALLEFEAHEGDKLSDLPNQPVYCFNVGYAWLGAENSKELRKRYRQLVDRLPMEFSDGKGLEAGQ